MSKVVFTATMNFNGIQHGTATMFTKETVRRHNGRLTVRDQNSASTTILRFPG
jgi:sensor histidine kinase regulating citrate/malate metabolism